MQSANIFSVACSIPFFTYSEDSTFMLFVQKDYNYLDQIVQDLSLFDSCVFRFLFCTLVVLFL